MTIMKFETFSSDDAILLELGQRLAQRRIDLGITQAELAERGGISKRTVERAEAGGSTQMASMIRIFRILGLLEGLDQMIPEAGPRPLDLLKLKGKKRRRASSKQRKPSAERDWTWGDEA